MSGIKHIAAMYEIEPKDLEDMLQEFGLEVVEGFELVDVPTIEIKPLDDVPNGSYRTGGLTGLTKEQIVQVLGFEPNIDDDPDKVVNSWACTVDGNTFCVWDYKGSHAWKQWSIYDPAGKAELLFNPENIQGVW